jgi:hypothetical protein
MTITYRGVKDSALTYAELDENFRDLREDTDLERVLINGNSANLSIAVPQVVVAGADVTESLAAGNTWTNTSIAILDGSLQTIINTNALSANSYTIEVGAAANAWINASIIALGSTLNSSVSNSSSNSTGYVNDVANAINSYVVQVGAAGNNYTNNVSNAINNYVVQVGAASNAYTIQVGAAANDQINLKLSNTTTTLNGSLTMTSITLSSNVTITLASNVGNTGQISWDGNYLYICVAPNQWKRTQLLSW